MGQPITDNRLPIPLSLPSALADGMDTHLRVRLFFELWVLDSIWHLDLYLSIYTLILETFVLHCNMNSYL